jgi:carboxypeptidase C (cathepsin A)
LPGQNITLSSKWYSGFFDVTKNKHLHYLFVESLHEPEKDPILVYFNGGPGSASIYIGFLGISPFIVHGEINTPLIPWNNSWCRNASVLMIDNPAGVGFSYAKRDIDLVHSDSSYTNDIIIFIKKFYTFWPKLAKNPLYIVGISYGGIYAPFLTWALHQHNQEVALNASSTESVPGHINIKGFIAANGATDWNTDPFIGTIEHTHAFNIIPISLY